MSDPASTPSSVAPAGDEIHLPENAFRELKAGETYQPVVPASAAPPEMTAYSLGWGLLMTVIFSAVSTYVVLKLGQGIETAIPIAILTIGFTAVIRLRDPLLQNVSVLSIGATSGIVAGGSVFVMPAIFIQKLDGLAGSPLSLFLQIMVVPLLGAILGLLFLIPFRRYFVAEMHGKLPFPEATATTEVLITGARGGRQALVLVAAMGIGGLFDGLVAGWKVWAESFSTRLVPQLGSLTTGVKAIFSMNTTAAIAGLGYIIGVRYAMIITAGSLVSYLVLVPLINHFGRTLTAVVPPGAALIGQMDADTIWDSYVRFMGIGGIVAAGVVSIVKMSPVIGQAMKVAVAQLRRGKAAAAEADAALPRTDRDLPLSLVALLIVAVVVVIWAYFRFSVLASLASPWILSFAAIGITVVIAFLFAAVSAWAVATISITPISGMTLMTLIFSAFVLSSLGLKGREGMLATLLIGGVVCTALSMTGTLVTEFKIAYWLGATPRKVQWGNLIGAVAAAVAVTGVMFLVAHTTGFADKKAVPAPQARAMADVIAGVLSTGSAPWFLYGLGAVLVLTIEALGINGLAFAMGMYLPMEYNTPLLVGALVSHAVVRSSRDPGVSHARNERGILFSSGLIAGGALVAIVIMALQLAGVPFRPVAWWGAGTKNWLALGMFALLLLYMYLDARRGAKEPTSGGDGQRP
jgi:putative OPT family oligopeptide transporter